MKKFNPVTSWLRAYLECLFENRPCIIISQYQKEIDLFLM